MRTRKWVLPPCPPYDIEGMEAWLSDMAGSGWWLAEEGIFLGIAGFVRREAAPVRYRLEAAQKPAGEFDERGGRPEEEAVALNAAFGWTYVARRGQFYIYRNEMSGAREINTDPQVQALAVKAVEKRQIWNFLGQCNCWLLYPILRIIRGFSLALTAAEVGLGITLICLLLPLIMLGDGLWEIVHLQGIKRKLMAGQTLAHRRDWQKQRPWYYVRRGAKLLFLGLAACLCLHLWGIERAGSDRQAIAVYTQPLPFATMRDFIEGEYELSWNDSGFDYMTRWHNSVVTDGVHWAEHATVTGETQSISGGLNITYYEARTEWLARLFAAEYARYDRARAGKNMTELEAPPLQVDSISCYTNELHFPMVILQKGRLVLRACFYQTGEEELPLAEWTGILAASLWADRE